MDKKYTTCCEHTKKNKKCQRKSDSKIFNLPRKYSKKDCLKGNIKGFSKKSSCAPYKDCKSKKEFLYNAKNPKNSRDIYSNDNPLDTIPIKFSTITDVKKTINTLETLYKQKKYTHRRISQVAMVMRVRLQVIEKKYPLNKTIKKRVKLSNKYTNFLKQRTKLNGEERYRLSFSY